MPDYLLCRWYTHNTPVNLLWISGFHWMFLMILTAKAYWYTKILSIDYMMGKNAFTRHYSRI